MVGGLQIARRKWCTRVFSVFVSYVGVRYCIKIYVLLSIIVVCGVFRGPAAELEDERGGSGFVSS